MSVHPVLTLKTANGLERDVVAAAELLFDSLAHRRNDPDVDHLLASISLDVSRVLGARMTTRLAGAAQLAGPEPGRLVDSLIRERWGAVSRG